MKNKIRFIYETSERKRIDIFLAENFPEFSRSHYKNMIINGQVTVNSRKIKPNYTLSFGDAVMIEKNNPRAVAVAAEDIPLDIVYEDSDMIVVNKKRGMVVHPAPGNYTGTLVNALLFYAKDLSGINGELRPGIVHRLDKDTTGLMVVAKNDFAHNALAKQIEEKSATRIYTALVNGGFKQESGVINAPIGRHKKDRKMMAVVANGKPAKTSYTVLKQYIGYTLLELKLSTGRTHQIRVHLKHIAHPVVCDPVYGIKKSKFSFNKQLLHAKKLMIKHPRTDKEMTFEADIPKDFQNILNKMKLRNS
jgi:23S rRNA pseudouridine1911/1915/1917 synthase